MKTIIKTALFIISISALMACSTIFGPPGSENELPPILSQPTPLLDRMIEGEPSTSLMPVKGGYYVWKADRTWHIRISNFEIPPILYSKGPYFTGMIFVNNGIISDVQKINVGPLTNVRYTMRDLSFRFEPTNDIEGFDFTIKPLDLQYCITLDLRVNGATIPNLVYLGSFMYIPDTLPITACFYK